MSPNTSSAGSSGRRRHRAAGLGALLSVFAPVAAHALMPLSPQLDPPSRAALVRALGGAGIDETASSAVEISLLAVLGIKPTANRYRYRETAPQLPDVDAAASLAGRGCAGVNLTARPKDGSRRPVAIRGVYCLSDPARYVWTARSLSVRAR